MSLWNVDDDATAYLMQHFLMYIQFESKFFPADPLRKAILATKKKYPDPSQWASFAVFGVPF
jgi:CHAT domain-containing protein